VVLEVLWPAKPFLSGTRSDVNANSVVARLTYGRTSFLFMGDAEADTERALLKRGAELSARVLKVAHHGSSYSTSSEFLAKVKPEQAVISCGRGNDYGHPAPETLERLKKAHVEVHRTDLDGGIVFRSDGDSLDVETGVARLADAGLGAAPAGGAVAAPAENGTRASGPGAAASGAAAAGSGAATASGLLDLNAASEGDLDALPGIGPSKARAIIDWRDRNGKFTSVDQLDEVKGIGPAMLEKIRPHVTVGGSAPATAPASALAAAAPAPAPGSAPGAPAPDDVEKEAPTGKVNINTASAEDLTALQGVGAALAQRIIDYRQAHGPFRRIADLDAVKGVGPAFLDKNRYFITVKVDLNEAAEAALRAVGLSDKTARALVEARSARGGKFKNTDEVRALVPAREWQNAEGLLWIAGG
jgi:competence ComEA-like helix-hairpin-helix protein